MHTYYIVLELWALLSLVDMRINLLLLLLPMTCHSLSRCCQKDPAASLLADWTPLLETVKNLLDDPLTLRDPIDKADVIANGACLVPI